jgi:hypothetical protein
VHLVGDLVCCQSAAQEHYLTDELPDRLPGRRGSTVHQVCDVIGQID